MDQLTDVTKFTPWLDWALIRVEEPEVMSSVIVTPDTVPQPLRKGVVLKVGPGRKYVDGKYVPTSLKPGERIVFFAAVLDTKQGKTIIHSLPDGHSLIREGDVLFVIDEGNPKVEV
jgi:co-chaperonin GroES (HSP10)